MLLKRAEGFMCKHAFLYKLVHMHQPYYEGCTNAKIFSSVGIYFCTQERRNESNLVYVIPTKWNFLLVNA